MNEKATADNSDSKTTNSTRETAKGNITRVILRNGAFVRPVKDWYLLVYNVAFCKSGKCGFVMVLLTL